MIGASFTDIVRAATDPRAQHLVATAAQAYAPQQTAKVSAAVREAQRHYGIAKQAVAAAQRRPGARPMMPMPMPVPMGPPVDPETGMTTHTPVNKNSQILTFAAIGAAALVVFLILRK